MAQDEGVLRFTFLTSVRDGLLMYLEGDNTTEAAHTVLVVLQGGSLVIEVNFEVDNMHQYILGNFLNDNRPHTLTIHHSVDNRQFEFKLDSGAAVECPYASHITPNFGTREVYFGGSLSDSMATENVTNFIGCLSDMLSAVGSSLSVATLDSELQALDVIFSTEMIQENCQDPCAGKDCGNGRCVAYRPDLAFCDCRESGMLGENCTEGEIIYIQEYISD